MDLFVDFLIKNFFLLCLTLGITFMVLRSYRKNSKVVTLPILVVSLALLLSILYFFEILSLRNPDLVFISTLCFALAFMLRPLILYLFMRLTINNKIVIRVSLILIAINAVIYLFSLFLFAPGLSHLVFWYENGEPHRGPLFFVCHGLVGFMMAFFIGYSIYSLKGRHRYDALSCLICAVFILIAVIVETFLDATYLLNTTIAISCLFYVIYLYQQALVRDGLTNLYDRKAYYYDLNKIKDKVTGIIVIDMNSLKMINDNEGHVAGDTALITIANAINDSIDYSHMDAYRMGGDEFIILSTSTKEGILEETSNKIKEALKDTRYSIAIGFAHRENNMKIHDLTLLADEMMYQDKTKYYQDNKIDRRKKR